jgi:hypothetical protein
MRADTFARLVTLEALIEAEIGWYLAHHPPAAERFREGMISRIGDLVDEIDRMDVVAAARVYDAVVDFLAELPEDDDDALVEATLRFRRAVERVSERAMRPRDLEERATWAVVLDELLGEMEREYRAAFRAGEGVDQRAYLRARSLLERARGAAERMARQARSERRAELRGDLDRLAFAVHSRRLPPEAVETLARAPRRLARRWRPSELTRVGAFIVGQLLRRREREPRKGERKGKP